MDFADWWDKWPGQFDPYMSALETYHAGGHAVARGDRPEGPADGRSAPTCSRSIIPTGSWTSAGFRRMPITAMRPGDSTLAQNGVHGVVHRIGAGRGQPVLLQRPGVLERRRRFPHLQVQRVRQDRTSTPRQAKVDANFHAIAGNTLFVSEAFNVPYPPDRIELLKRISPPTMDVAYPVDLFVRKPAHIWNMPVERPFGKWSVLAVFNFTGRTRTASSPPRWTRRRTCASTRTKSTSPMNSGASSSSGRSRGNSPRVR